MVAALERAEADHEVRAVVVTGSGGKAFCAGGDVRAVWKSIVEENGGKPSALSRDFFINEYRLNRRIHHTPGPPDFRPQSYG